MLLLKIELEEVQMMDVSDEVLEQDYGIQLRASTFYPFGPSC
jgi:hypothetical protein